MVQCVSNLKLVQQRKWNYRGVASGCFEGLNKRYLSNRKIFLKSDYRNWMHNIPFKQTVASTPLVST